MAGTNSTRPPKAGTSRAKSNVIQLVSCPHLTLVEELLWLADLAMRGEISGITYIATRQQAALTVSSAGDHGRDPTRSIGFLYRAAAELVRVA